MAPGQDNIKPELMKYIDKESKKLLHSAINKARNKNRKQNFRN